MATLTKQAHETIKWDYRGLTIVGYTRHYFGDQGWHGDKCGCIDDRCIGYHHDEQDECHCFPNWLDDYAKTIIAARPATT